MDGGDGPSILGELFYFFVSCSAFGLVVVGVCFVLRQSTEREQVVGKEDGMKTCRYQQLLGNAPGRCSCDI